MSCPEPKVIFLYLAKKRWGLLLGRGEGGGGGGGVVVLTRFNIPMRACLTGLVFQV